MAGEEDPEERIRELERPLADTARASELGGHPPTAPGGSPPTAPPYPPGPPPPPPATPWTYGGGFGPPQRPSGNRTWWILGTVIVVAMLALAGGIAAYAAHQFSGVRSSISSPPTSGGVSTPPSTPSGPTPSRTKTTKPSTSATSPAPAPGGRLSVSGINENRTLACNDNVVTVSGVSNTVVISGHCASISVSGVQNAITVDAVDAIEASGFNNKVTYHTGTPKISKSGDSNEVQQG